MRSASHVMVGPAPRNLLGPIQLLSKYQSHQLVRKDKFRQAPDKISAHAHAILDPANGPLIGVKLHVLTRKTLGGIQTDLQSRALDGDVVVETYVAGNDYRCLVIGGKVAAIAERVLAGTLRP